MLFVTQDTFLNKILYCIIIGLLKDDVIFFQVCLFFLRAVTKLNVNVKKTKPRGLTKLNVNRNFISIARFKKDIFQEILDV